MNSFCKFDICPGCEEEIDFAPSRSDWAASLGDDEITALYASPAAPTLAGELFALFSANPFPPIG